MSPYFAEVHKRWSNQCVIDSSAVVELRNVALGVGQQLQELRLWIYFRSNGRQLNHACGILKNLQRFNSADLIEEPAATGVHEQGMALHLQQLECLHGFYSRELPLRVLFKEDPQACRGPVQNHVDIIVAGCPGVTQ